MRYRHWLLLAAAAAFFYSAVLIRLDFFMQILPTYGDADIHAGSFLAITFILSWVALEITHFLRIGSRGQCECGYSLKGVKCPECGRDQGDGPA
jgi:hypothetical protein